MPEPTLEELYQFLAPAFAEEASANSVQEEKILEYLHEHNVPDLKNAKNQNILHYIIGLLDEPENDQNVRKHDIAVFLAKNFPELLRERDSEGRTPLHTLFLKQPATEFPTYLALMDEFISDELLREALEEPDADCNSLLYYVTRTSVDFVDKRTHQKFIERCLKLGGHNIHDNKIAQNELLIKLAHGLNIEKLDVTREGCSFVDRDGRGALHYLSMQRNTVSITKNALSGILKFSDCNAKDAYGRTAFHYALLNGKTTLVKAMLKLGGQKKVTEWSDDKGLSALMMAAYSGNISLFNEIKKHKAYKQNEPYDSLLIRGVQYFSDKTDILETIDGFLEKTENSGVWEAFSKQQKLSFLAGIGKLFPHLKESIAQYVKENILVDSKPFRAGDAFGIEVETYYLPSTANIPLDMLQDWYGFDRSQDSSVIPHYFMKPDEAQAELGSPPIQSVAQFQHFLDVCDSIYQAGGKIGKSTGLHVHFNIKGSTQYGIPPITEGMDLKGLTPEEVQLAITKQILVNFNHNLPLLLGNLRWGDVYEGETPHAELLTHEEIQAIMNAKSFEEIIAALKKLNGSNEPKYKAINFLSINKHGTIEVRIHEGTTDPRIIKAWVNYLRRLVDVSVSQVQEMVNSEVAIETWQYQPHQDVESFVYILMAEREYQTSFSLERGGRKEADVEPITPEEHEFYQDIISSPVYGLLQRTLRGEDWRGYFLKEILPNVSPEELKTILKDFQQYSEACSKWPGVGQLEIDIDFIKKDLKQLRSLVDFMTLGKVSDVHTKISEIGQDLASVLIQLSDSGLSKDLLKGFSTLQFAKDDADFERIKDRILYPKFVELRGGLDCLYRIEHQLRDKLVRLMRTNDMVGLLPSLG